MKMKDFHKKQNEYHEHNTEANRMRGEIISNFIGLERIIDEVIAWYFCENNNVKRNSLLEVVLNPGKIGFKAKVSILKTISKNLFPDIQDELCEIIKHINKDIIDARNAIAHRALEQIDLEQSYTDKETVYKDRYSNATYKLDNDKFADVLKSTSKYTGFFIDLMYRLQHKHTQPPS